MSMTSVAAHKKDSFATHTGPFSCSSFNKWDDQWKWKIPPPLANVALLSFLKNTYRKRREIQNTIFICSTSKTVIAKRAISFCFLLHHKRASFSSSFLAFLCINVSRETLASSASFCPINHVYEQCCNFLYHDQNDDNFSVIMWSHII